MIDEKNNLLSTLREIKYGKEEKKNKLPDLSEFVLIEKNKLINEFYCGKCDSRMRYDLYLRISDKKNVKHVICEGCGLEFWNE
ncbi:MAG: hypothetical protein ACTSVY_00840 [Candidatus Helarchaeota archaeon]